MANEQAPIVHLLWEGRAMCGMEGLPGDWPAGNKWVALNDKGAATDANCEACIDAALTAAAGDVVYTKAADGKYDRETATVLRFAQAEAVLVVVKGGRDGDGFSVAVDLRRVDAKTILAAIPVVLRDIADNIEAQERQKKEGLQ